MRSLLLASAALLALAPAAMAQGQTSAPSQSNPPSQSNAQQDQATSGSAEQAQHLRANLRTALEKAGYKDIRVNAMSFMVRARDGDGNPVMMTIGPDSFTEVTDVSSGTGNDGKPSTTGSVTGNSAATFASVPQTDELSSKVVGLDIYNNDNKDIGQIKDIAMSPNGRSQAYIVSVGGFLGMGEHYVAVNTQAVNVSYNDHDKKWHATMNASADQLKAAPEFKYTGRWQSNKT